MKKSNTDDIYQLVTIRDWIRWAVSQFNKHNVYYGHGTNNAWDEALYIVTFALSLPFDLPDAWLDTRLTFKERQLILKLLKKRYKKRLPAPYITREAWFCDLSFYVDQRVLIPRSPIAELIKEQFNPWCMRPVKRLLDLCCGSGCIGIASAYHFPKAEVVLADLSTKALNIAKRNVQSHALEERVECVQSDVFSQVDGTFDLIVSNPPYVDPLEMADLPKEYQHEPRLALEAGTDGLTVVREILRQASKFLNEQGLLVVEVGNTWQKLEEAFPEVTFTWVDFQFGGHGVFVFSKEELLQFESQFESDRVI